MFKIYREIDGIKKEITLNELEEYVKEIEKDKIKCSRCNEELKNDDNYDYCEDCETYLCASCDEAEDVLNKREYWLNKCYGCTEKKIVELFTKYNIGEKDQTFIYTIL